VTNHGQTAQPVSVLPLSQFGLIALALVVSASWWKKRKAMATHLRRAINGWNRVAIAFRSIAGEYQPAARKIGASDEETSAHIVSRVQHVPRVQPADCTGCKGHFADIKTVARYTG
jgi:hypothetical protein